MALVVVSALLAVAVLLLVLVRSGFDKQPTVTPAAPSPTATVTATVLEPAVTTQSPSSLGGSVEPTVIFNGGAYNTYIHDPRFGALALPSSEQTKQSGFCEYQDEFTLASGIVILLGAALDAMVPAAQGWADNNQATFPKATFADAPGLRVNELGYTGWCASGTSTDPASRDMSGHGCFCPTAQGGAYLWIWAPAGTAAGTVGLMLNSLAPAI